MYLRQWRYNKRKDIYTPTGSADDGKRGYRYRRIPAAGGPFYLSPPNTGGGLEEPMVKGRSGKVVGGFWKRGWFFLVGFPFFWNPFWSVLGFIFGGLCTCLGCPFWTLSGTKTPLKWGYHKKNTEIRFLGRPKEVPEVCFLGPFLVVFVRRFPDRLRVDSGPILDLISDPFRSQSPLKWGYHRKYSETRFLRWPFWDPFWSHFGGFGGGAGKHGNTYNYNVFQSFSPLLWVIFVSGSGTHFGVSFWTHFGTTSGASGGGCPLLNRSFKRGNGFWPILEFFGRPCFYHFWWSSGIFFGSVW